MTVSISYNGSTYNIPITGDSSGWGDDLSNYLIDLANNSLTLGSSKIKVRVPTSSPVTVLSTDGAILANLSSTAAVTVNLPTGVTNQYYVIGDAKGDAGTNYITINTSSSQTIDGASTFVINWNWGAVGLVFNGTQWNVINVYRPQTLASFPSRTSSTASTTATINDNLVWLTFAGARTFTLPSSAPNGLIISVGDGNTAFTNNITVNPPGGQTIGLGASYTISSNSSIIGFQFNSADSDWKVITNGSTPTFALVRNVSGSNLQIQTDAASGKSVVIAPNASAQITVNPATSTNADVTFNGTGAITLPSGAGSAQPSVPVAGMLRYNSTTSKTEQYEGGAWRSLVDESTTQTLTNKTLSGNTATNLITGTGTITFPTSTTDTVVTLAATQTLTNKDIDGATASNSSRITLPKATKSTLDGLSRKQGTVVFASDQNKAYVDNGTSLVAIGSGSSGLYSTIDFEDNSTGGISTYADAAGSTPVDGTGGSPSSTFTVNSSSPLRGTYDGLFTKSAANRQGEGFSLPITLSNADLGKTIQVIFDIKTSANFVSGDMVFYVYDVTNSTLITPSQTILPTGTSSQYSVAFQATTGTSYRLIWHVATTSALAYTVEVDQISYTSVVRPVVAGISDWKVSSVTYSAGFGTVTNNVCEERREGDSIVFRGSLTSTSPAASIASVTIPYTIDTTKLSIPANTSAQDGNTVGTWTANVVGVSNAGYVLTAPGTSTTTLYFSRQLLDSASHLTPSSSTSTQVTSGGVLVWEARIPVANLSSNITLASTSGALQFVSNSTITDANDTTSFTYGALGSPLPGTLTALRTKRVQLSSPYTSIDDLDLFIVPVTDLTPIKVGNGLIRNNAGTIIASPLTIQNTTTYGVGIQPVSGSKTQIDVVFGQYSYPSGATFASAGANWVTGNANWFVKDRSSIGGAELAPATITTQGTVAMSQWTSYTPTFVGLGTVTVDKVVYRRVGDSLQIKGRITTGTVIASTIQISLPVVNGVALTLDTTKAPTGGTQVVGQWVRAAAVSPFTTLIQPTTDASNLYVGGNGAGAGTSVQGGTALGSTEVQSFYYTDIPISGWN